MSTVACPPLRSSTTPSRSTIRVLLAEPDDELSERCAEALRRSSYVVEIARDGSRVEQLLEQSEFDVVLGDVDLPGLDGMSLLRAAKEKNPDVPVVLMSGNRDLEAALDAMEHGALRYLVKPFTDDSIREVVIKAARLNRLARLKRSSLSAIGTGDLRPGDYTSMDLNFSRALTTLWMACQPIVNDRGKIFGYEALVRTDEPTLASPVELFASAERLGRLHELGQLIRKMVADLIPTAPDNYLFFVNLHTYDLTDEELYSPTAPLSQFSRRVVLEITERASLESIPQVPTKVARLRALGFRIAIDDLGAGYAGLTSLAQLEPDLVKLDMALIRNVDREPVKRKLVASMTQVCRDMQMMVVAEGVETEAEFAVVKELRCHLFQGYLFGRPQNRFGR